MSKIFDKIVIPPEVKARVRKQLQEIDEKYERGYVSRFSKPLPEDPCTIAILKDELEGEQEYICEWKSAHAKRFDSDVQPSEGYLGTAKVIEGPYKGIGFHAWEQNVYEFEYYQIIDT